MKPNEKGDRTIGRRFTLCCCVRPRPVPCGTVGGPTERTRKAASPVRECCGLQTVCEAQWRSSDGLHLSPPQQRPPSSLVFLNLSAFCLAWQITESTSFNMSIAHHDIYSAYLLVCQVDGAFVGDITGGFVNLDPEGGLTQHLPIELTMLPSIYSVGF